MSLRVFALAETNEAISIVNIVSNIRLLRKNFTVRYLAMTDEFNKYKWR